MNRPALKLFEATGVELEYAIVDRDSLDVKAVADELLKARCGAYESELELGDVAWSNELALHVIEMKTNGPVSALAGLAGRFQEHVREMSALLEPMGARLMPGGMHPWMDPFAELRLWPHEYSPVYEAFHRVFDCRGHGWANLQSAHVNLPFDGDEEFGRLHAALRVVLPLLPALAASSPVADGKPTGYLDTRLEVYRGNARRVPSVTGQVVPEPVFDRAAYEGRLLGGIYDDLAPLDPDGTLRHEWVNARGCIARFDRGSIEIRVLDVQECPAADVAITAAIVAVVRALAEGRLSTNDHQRGFDVEPLATVFLDAVRHGESAVIGNADYLATFGYPGWERCTAGELWAHLIETVVSREDGWAEWEPSLRTILRDGCLSSRLIGAIDGDPRREHLVSVWRRLCDCLESGTMFDAGH